MPSVSDDAVIISNGPGLIQNLGPDEVYIGEDGVTSSTGIKVLSGQAITMAVPNEPTYAVSAGTSDVRFLSRCQGISSVEEATDTGV